jgi:hypothetical protein
MSDQLFLPGFNSQKIVFFVGPDGCGKTEISKAVADKLKIPYFKCQTERENWISDLFKNSLYFDYVLPQFVEQTGVSFVSDRGFPCEYAYSRVYGRRTDDNMVLNIDRNFARLGAQIVFLYRRDYSKARSDEFVKNNELERIHYEYEKFSKITKCRVVKMYVDDFDNDLQKQLPILLHELSQERR